MKEKLLTLTLLLILPMAVSRASAKTSGITDIPDSIPRSVVHYQDGVPYIETTMVPYVDDGIPEQNPQTSSQGPRKANTGNTWTIGSGGNFSDINAAMSDSRVAAGDILELKPGTILKGDQTINKAIHLKGNGYQMDSDGNLASNVAQIQGYLYINAEGTCVSNLAISMFIDGNGSTIIPYLIVYSSQVVIEGCYINGKIIGHANNATVRQCFFRALLGYNSSGWLIQNNIIASQYSNGYNLITGLNNATINHNTVYSIFSSSHTSNYLITSSVSSCTITNNIIVHFPSNNNYAGTYNGTIESASLTNNTVSRNVFSGSSPNSSNRGGVNAIGDIFDYSKYVSSLYKVVYYDACFHLVAGSPAAGYATDGGDCGPWSGAYPYVVGGTVGSGDDNPDTTFKDGDIFTAQTAEGVEMTFKVISASEKTCQVGEGEWQKNSVDKNTSGTITIPETIRGLTVTNIGYSAFHNCNSLTNINIPNSVTNIGNFAFEYCSKLTNITIPDAVTNIGSYAFEACYGLTSIYIPKSVIAIGSSAFSYCTNMKNITVDAQNPIFDSRNNCNAIIKTSSNTLVAGCQSTIIPNSITVIGSNAFSGCSNLKSITIPNSVTTIEGNTFTGCSSMTSINIPSSVTTIGQYLFGYCSSLTTITVDTQNPKYDSRNQCNAIIETSTNTIVAGCKSTTIPQSVTKIGNNAFYACSGLSNIIIPNSIKTIDQYAFQYSSNLKEITIPNSVTAIGNRAFYKCSNLTQVTSEIQEPFATGEEAFAEIPSDATLYVPAGTVAQYRALADWNRFTNITEIQDAGGYTKAELQAMLDAIGQRLDAIGSMINDAEAMYKNLSGNYNISDDVRAVVEKEWSRMSYYMDIYYDALSQYNIIKQEVQAMTGNDNGTLYNMIVALQTKIDQAENEVRVVIAEMLKTIEYYAAEDMENRMAEMARNINIILTNILPPQNDLNYIREQLGDYYFMRKGTDEFLARYEMAIARLDETTAYVYSVDEYYKYLLDHHSITTIEDIVNFYTGYADLQNRINNINNAIYASYSEIEVLKYEFENLEVNFPDENLAYAIRPTELSNGPQIGYKQSLGFVLSSNGMMWFEQKSGADFYFRDADGHYIVATSDGTTQAGTKAEATVWTGLCDGKGNYTFTAFVNSRYLYLGCNGTNENSALTVSNTNYRWTITEFKQDQDHDYDWSIGSGGDFADVNSAMSDSRVKDGDVLQVLNGTILNGTTYITKAVTIKGNGYEDKSDGHIYGIYIDCEGVTLKNLHNGYIYVRANNAIIERCRTSSISGRENYESDDVTIRGCLVLGYVCSYYNNISYGWKISNNIIIATNYWGNALDYLEEATVDHNLIINYESDVYGLYAVGAVNNSSFTNNIFLRPAYSQGISDNAINSATKFEYNIISNSGSYSKWPTNITGYNNLAKLFECSGERTTDTYYKLVAGSPALDYANDGGDCGPWSGVFPYWINGKEVIPEPIDPTHWKLDPKLTTAPERYEFATLEALVNYMLNNMPEKSVTVSVMDATYTMDVLSYLIKNNSFNDVDDLINYLLAREDYLGAVIGALVEVLHVHDITINFGAPQEAIFQFNIQYSQTINYIKTLMEAKATEMLEQGISQEYVNERKAYWQSELGRIPDLALRAMQRFVDNIKTTNISIFIDGKPYPDDSTQWKLDPTLTTNTGNHEFATLDALVSYLFSHWLEEDVTVNVADATYTMDVLPDLSANSYNDVEDMLSYLEMQLEVLEKEIYSLESYNITISMEAPQMAVFRFNIQYSQALQYIQTFMIAKATEMLAQGMSQEEVDTRRAAWDAYLASRIDKCNGLIQVLVSHIKTTNISILIDNKLIRNYNNDIDPNDLLALKNIYNILGGNSWTNKKWKFNDYGYSKDDFPGVTFDDEGYVVQIELPNNNLRGSINTSWKWQLGLPRLTGLYLQKNNISGDLSPWLRSTQSLRALDMSYNNITEISDTIPPSITSLILNNQNREWYRPDGVTTDPLKIEAMSDMTPIRLYLSANQTVVMPSLFTYNHKSQTHSARPTIYIINAEGIDKYGYFKSSGEDTYSLAWKDNEYTEKQNAPCYVRFDNPYGSVYPAYLRYIEGDANMSGYTDVLDVQTTLNYVLNGGGVWQFNRSAANTYEDNLINVQDIVCMVNIVLNNEAVAEGIILNTSSSRRHLRRAADAMDAQGWLYTEKGRVMLTTVNEVGAIDLELKGVSTSQVSLLLNHSQYQMIGRNTEEGSRYVIFSPTGQPIPASEEVALLAVSSQTELIGAQAADMEAQELELAIGEPTGLEAIDNGQLTNDNAPIYNVAGQRLSKMQRGINITNGRKVLK